jgi:hypothetical protein
MRIRPVLAAITVAAAIATIHPAHAAPTRAVAGRVSLYGGGSLALRAATSSQGLVTGAAASLRLSSAAPMVTLSVDCLAFGRPFETAPFHVAETAVYASGVDRTGRRYYIAANVSAVHSELVSVTRRRGTAPCKATTYGAEPTTGGSLVVTPQ